MTLRYTKAPTTRQLKVSEEIKKIISIALTENVIDHPLLENAFISIVEVRTSADLKLSTVFFSIINGDKKVITQVLNLLAPEVRRVVARQMKLRQVPDVRFVYDDVSDNVAKIQGILKDL